MSNNHSTMENSPSPSVNITQIPYVAVTRSRLPMILVVALLFCTFLCFSILMVTTFCTSAGLRQHARYVLFVYMLINDTAYIFTAGLLSIISLLAYKIPALMCLSIIVVSTSTFQSTPNTLAVMALERFVAVCFPLRHADICRVERSWLAVVVLCVTACLPQLCEIIILTASVEQTSFYLMMRCYREALIVTVIQSTLRSAVDGTTFSLVALIIIYTFIRIMQEARKITGDKMSSSKATKTVMLHAVQLLLCLTSFAYPVMEKYNRNVPDLAFINLILFMLLPRILSPLIYGLRDETFRKHIQKYILHLLCKANTRTGINRFAIKT